MGVLSSIFSVLFAAISLDGVTGDNLRAVATFDANRVRVGDPVILHIDFVGPADYSALHPPEISREVDAAIFKVDDLSARTETYELARRLTYRLRIARPGTHEFPPLTFIYKDRQTGAQRRVSTGAVPIRVRNWTQATLAGLDEETGERPMPDGLVLHYPGVAGGDGEFAWRRACRCAKADAFVDFDFPEARLNEAACAILEGNWGRALRVYSTLEWRTGQTPAIERGLVAALSLKTDGAAVELPVWRQVCRPVLRFAWLGRMLIVLGVLAALVLLVFLAGRFIRWLAILAVMISIPFLPASAESSPFDRIGKRDPFYEMRKLQEQMERQMQRQMQQMERQMRRQSGVRTSVSVNGVPVGGTGEEAGAESLVARLSASRNGVHVGEPFDFVVSIEAPKTMALENIGFRASNLFGMTVTGRISQLADAPVTNRPDRVVHRFLVPVRYDVPIRQNLQFTVNGMMSQSSGRRNGFSFFSFSQSFAVETQVLQLEIKPLPSAGQYSDFDGAVGTSFRMSVKYDHLDAVPDDVITGECTLFYRGFMPDECRPRLSASVGVKNFEPFENGRTEREAVRWKFYLVASETAKATPVISLRYYNPETKKYHLVECAAQPIRHVPETEPEGEKVIAVDTAGNGVKDAWNLRFMPSERARVVAVRARVPSPKVTEESGVWVRIELSDAAGWIRKEDMK